MIERERQRHRKREKQAPCREPDGGTRSRVSRIMPWAAGGAKPLHHWGFPNLWLLKEHFVSVMMLVNLTNSYFQKNGAQYRVIVFHAPSKNCFLLKP